MSIVNIKNFTVKGRFQNLNDIYEGTNQSTGERVIIKVRKFDLSFEAKVCSILSGANGFPTFQHYHVEDNQCFLINSMLGKTLQELFMDSNHNFSLKTIIMIADQLLQRLEFLYNKSIVHGRISPEHVLIGSTSSEHDIRMFGKPRKTTNLLHLVNYTHCEKIKESLKFVPNLAKERKLFGKEDFLSVNVLLKKDLSPKDDLESLAYMLIYFFNKELPWTGMRNTLDKKVNLTPNELCSGLPKEFYTFVKAIKDLGPNDVPDYRKYRQLFRDLLERSGITYDGVFDWNVKKPISFSFNYNNSEETSTLDHSERDESDKTKLLSKRYSKEFNGFHIYPLSQQNGPQASSSSNFFSKGIRSLNVRKMPPQLLARNFADMQHKNIAHNHQHRIKSWSIKESHLDFS